MLAEVLRVLRPGGTLIGSDSLPSTQLHEFHEGDVYNPLEPATLLTRLQTIGFGAVMISVDRGPPSAPARPSPAPPGAAGPARATRARGRPGHVTVFRTAKRGSR